MPEDAAHPCQACGRTTLSADDFCAFCHNGYVRPHQVGLLRWQGGVLVRLYPQQ